MATIEGAVQSVNDSASRLRVRFRGSEEQVVRLFRAQMQIDETRSQISLHSDPDGAVGEELTGEVLQLSAAISSAPSDGSPPFDDVLDEVSEVFTKVMERLA